MNNKIPCGGFYLSDTLGVDENGKLGVNGGEPYKSLVTDGDGGVKWEERLAYDDRKLSLDVGEDMKLVKVADEVPSWASAEASIKIWNAMKENIIIPPTAEHYSILGNGSFSVNGVVYFITTNNFNDNVDMDNFIFPEKGVYFGSGGPVGDFYVAGIASADSDTPEITWDGNVGTLKTIDQKFIPSELNEIVLPSSTPGSSKKFKITVDDSGAISATAV